MHCPFCGAPLKENAHFCSSCGSAAPAAEPTVAEVQNPQMYAEQPVIMAEPPMEPILTPPAFEEQPVIMAEPVMTAEPVMQNTLADMPPMESLEMPPAYAPPAYVQPVGIPVTVPNKAPSPEPVQPRRQRRLPSLALRVPLQILSFLLSVLLIVCLLGTALVMDCNRLLSAGSIKQVVNAVFGISSSKVTTVRPLPGAAGAPVRMDNATMPDLGDIEIPADVLTGGDTEELIDWICDLVEEQSKGQVKVDRESVTDFVNESTFTDYLAEKAAGYAQDFINETTNTEITVDELMDLLDENQDLIEKTFDVEITRDMKKDLEKSIEKVVEENDLNEMIHEQVFTAMEESIDSSLPGISMASIRSYLQLLTSDQLMYGAIAACVVLFLLLCALNFYNVPAGMTWGSVSCIIAGAILSVPVAILQISPGVLTDTLNLPVAIGQLLGSFLGLFSPVHYGVLIIGFVLLILSIIWRIIRAAVRSANTH